jgi:hypothetical protein
MNRRNALGMVLSGTLLSIVALPAMAAGPVPAASPLEIVQKIYAASAGRDGKYQGISGFTDKTIRKLYFSKLLLAALSRADALSKKRNEPIIDFDPVLNTQEDPEVKNLHIAVESETPMQSTVAATFVSYGEQNIVRYLFIKEGDVWKLDDMHGESGTDKWSLRAMIK